MGDVSVASTTDNQEQVNQAAGGVPQDEEQPELKAPPTGDAQVESGEQEPEPQPEAAKPAEEKAPKNLSKKFDKLYREKKELEERLAAIEARTPPATEPAQRQAPQVPLEVAAKFDTFDSWSEKQLAAGQPASIDDFLEARDAWKEARDQQKAEREAQAEYQAEVASTYNERIEAFKVEHDDWDEVVGGSEVSLPPGVGPAILELENGPDVAYYLGKNPTVAKKLAELSPFLAVAEVGRIAARLEKAQPEEQPVNGARSGPDRAPIVSKAPPPIRPLGGNSVRAAVDLNDPNMDYQTYAKLREQQEKSRYRR